MLWRFNHIILQHNQMIFLFSWIISIFLNISYNATQFICILCFTPEFEDLNWEARNSNSKKMTISSTGKDMLVQFFTNDDSVQRGFRAYFHYIPFDSNCANWLNMTAQILKSPDYHPTIDCSWVITAPTIDSTIIIHFETFEVKLHLI